MRTSRLAAKVDNNAIADGFQIYLHGFVLTSDRRVGDRAAGHERAVAAGAPLSLAFGDGARTSPASRTPAIVGRAAAGVIQNLVDERAKPAQDALLTIASDNPQRTLSEVMKMRAARASRRAREGRRSEAARRGAGGLVRAASCSDFASLLLLENLGPRTLQSLALIAEVIHGTPTRFTDPARFSFAHGGKDRHPFPVPLKTYDESIAVLRRSLDAAKVGDTDKIDGMKRLEKFVRAIEKRYSPEADFDAVMAHEHAISPVARRPHRVRPFDSRCRPSGSPSLAQGKRPAALDCSTSPQPSWPDPFRIDRRRDLVPDLDRVAVGICRRTDTARLE